MQEEAHREDATFIDLDRWLDYRRKDIVISERL